MKTDFIHERIPTPLFRTKKCKLLALVLQLFLQYTTYLVALIVWYFYDYFIALATLVLSFIIMGIIRSKLQNSAIPPKQREYHYNNQGIANWYISREFCFDEEEIKNS